MKKEFLPQRRRSMKMSDNNFFLIPLWALCAFLVNSFFPPVLLHAQNAESPSGAVSAGAAYLIPRQIFVGDPATLVVPLPASEQNRSDIILSAPSDDLPADPNIDFHRIILERRSAGSRLMIEFTPFIPGVLKLPDIEIGDIIFDDLTITVNSLINDKTSPVLSGAASALAIPGTALMLYGSLSAIIVFLLLVILFLVKGRTFLKNFIKKWKRRNLFSALRKTVKRLHKDIFKGTDKRFIIDKLSDEFRIFLSHLTGNYCRAMTAKEFEYLQSSLNIQKESEISLVTFFRTCDDLRFSGESINSKDLFSLLDDIKQFISILEHINENEEKEKNEPQSKLSAVQKEIKA